MSKEIYASKDEQLFNHIRSLQAGNTDSYTEIYNLSAKYLYKIIYDIVQDYHLTEDMLQEVFLKIYNNIGSLQSPEAYFVWAGRIATNLCIRYIHKYRKEVLATASEDGEGNEEFIFDTVAEDNEMFIPESVLDNKEHQRMIGDVIDALSVEQKLAVQCFYFEEMSVKEIAALMECSEGTIKSRLNYARKSIKESVLNIEKTQGTKLYSFGAVPVLLLIFKNKAQAAVPTSALAGTGEALAGMYGSNGLVAGAGSATGATVGVGASAGASVAGGVAMVGGTTAASGAAVAAGISGKIIAIIVAATVITSGAIGGIIWAITNNDKNESYKEVTTEEITTEKVIASDEEIGDEDDTTSDETISDEDLDINIYTIPEGAKYVIAATGEVLEAGQNMPTKQTKEDIYYYGDYKYTYVSGGWKVELNNIEDYQTRTSFDEILDSIAGKNVENLSGLFMDCTSLVTAPVIPEGAVNLVGAFQGCISLKEAPVIPNGVRHMADTFNKCESLLVAPKLPDSVEILDGCFACCVSLVEAPVIPDGVTTLMDTFSHCTSLEVVPNIPDGVTNLNGTFIECISLVDAPKLPKNAESISSTFDGCVNLETAPEIPYGVTNMDYAFYGCSKLTEFGEIPETVTSMKATFHSCINLIKAPNIPSNVTELSYTFADCTGLVTAPIIPASVLNMDSLFINCSSLTGVITINANPTVYDDCFNGVNFEYQGIELQGSSTMLEELQNAVF